MQQSFRVGLVQMAMSADPGDNLRKVVARVGEAAAKGARIVCLPELYRTQYFCQKEDQALFDLYEAGTISYEEGLRNADSKNELRLRIKLESKREDRLQAEASSTLRIVDESNDGKVY